MACSGDASEEELEDGSLKGLELQAAHEEPLPYGFGGLDCRGVWAVSGPVACSTFVEGLKEVREAIPSRG